MTPPRVRLVSVTKRYAGRAVVDRMSLDVAPGDRVALLGPSGCGKTTLLRLVAGLDVPDEGEIWMDGQLVSTAGRTVVPPHARGIGFVFQDLALWPHLTVRGNLTFVLRAAGMPRHSWPDRVRDVLRLVHLDALADRHPHTLSGGEQQRAALARALAGEPRVLLLDEPFSSLDTELRQSLRLEVAALQRRLALTTLCVTHDREDADAVADRLVTMARLQPG